MKTLIITFAISVLGFAAWAGPTKFKVDNFNEMIQENQKSEAQLRTDLQKEAGIQFSQEKPGTIAKEKLQIHNDTEQVAVSSSQAFWTDKKDHSKKLQEKADMNRLSQELDDAFSH